MQTALLLLSSLCGYSDPVEGRCFRERINSNPKRSTFTLRSLTSFSKTYFVICPTASLLGKRPSNRESCSESVLRAKDAPAIGGRTEPRSSLRS